MDDLVVPLLSCEIERRLPVLIAGLEGSVVVHKQCDHVSVPAFARMVERGVSFAPARRVLYVNVCTIPQQELGH
eukprot:187067-Prorocentrum_lima.AAC.1